jgi:DNA polymerase
MSASNLEYLKALEIDVWLPRDELNHDGLNHDGSHHNKEAIQTSVEPQSLHAIAEPIVQETEQYQNPAEVVETEPDKTPSYGVSTFDWQELEQAVSTCVLCELAQSRTQTVFGVGNQKADLFIIGEAPGADEDKQGEPFVGKAGQLLNAMLKAIGFARGDVYIANILKCRPPNNRDPKAEEAQLCATYLQRQITLVQPKLILALGRIAAQRLLDSSTTLGRMRGQVFHLENNNTPVMVTYHPAYLLRSPAEKAKSWEDLKACKRFILAAKQKASL